MTIIVFVASLLFACAQHPSTTEASATELTTAPALTDAPTTQPTIFPSFVLGELQAKMMGIGEHANMACVQYAGNQSDLSNIELSAEFIQNGNSIETQPLQGMEGNLCFEMTDAMYRPGIPVTAMIVAVSEDYALENGTQTIALGDFSWKPFIYPIFAQSDFSEQNEFLKYVLTHGYELGREREYYAADFCKGYCDGNEYASGEGTQVFMPFSVQIVAVRETRSDSNYPNNYNIWVFHPYTGFIFELNHQRPGPIVLEYLSSVGFQGLPTLSPHRQYYSGYPYIQEIIPYDQNSVLSYWGPSDHPNGPPHLHLEGQIHYPTVGLSHPDLFPETNWIDGDPDTDWGNPRYGNCFALGLEYGPCYDENGQLVVANISPVQFLMSDWIDPDK